jgi:hypothetical protein
LHDVILASFGDQTSDLLPPISGLRPPTSESSGLDELVSLKRIIDQRLQFALEAMLANYAPQIFRHLAEPFNAILPVCDSSQRVLRQKEALARGTQAICHARVHPARAGENPQA